MALMCYNIAQSIQQKIPLADDFMIFLIFFSFVRKLDENTSVIETFIHYDTK